MPRQAHGNKWARCLLLASTVSLLGAACNDADERSSASTAAASVNGNQILVSQVTEARRRFEGTSQYEQLSEQSDPRTARSQFERVYLREQIKRLVLKSRAEELGIDVEDEMAQRLESQQSAYPSEKAFRKALESMGYTLGEFSDLIRNQVLEARLRDRVTADVAVQSKPTAEDLKRYYQSNLQSYRQTRVQHILVKEMAIAAKLSTTLKDAPRTERKDLFAKLARKHSTDTSNAEEGGNLGWVAPGQFVEPFESTMHELGIGEVSTPVSTNFGVHVILVTGRRLQGFEDVRGEISQQFIDNDAERIWSEWLLEAYKRADIELHPRYGKLDPATGQIVGASA